MGPSGLVDDWWKYLIIALIVLFVGYQILKLILVPRPTFVPHPDPGVSHLGTESGPLGFDLQVELDPDVSAADYGVKTEAGSFIKSERKSNG